MKKLKGERKQDKYGRWYTQTSVGRFYDRISKDKLIDGGFHGYSGKQRCD